MNLIEIIKEYGLSIRQIPKELKLLTDIRHFKEGDEVVVIPLDMKHINYRPFKAKRQNDKSFVFDDENQTIGRKRIKKIVIPNNSGHWLCKQTNNSNSMVQWNINKDNLSETLEGSIKQFLKTI